LASFREIAAGKDEVTLYQALLDKLKGKGLPTLFWGGGDPTPVMLEHGFSPLLSTVYSYAADMAKGGALRLARALAELDIATWNEDPLATFLGWLALEDFSVKVKPPAFAVGTERLTNPTAAPIVVPRAAAFATNTGLIYRMTDPTAITVPAGAGVGLPAVYVTIQAEKSGPAYNVDPGTIIKLVTSIAGLQVSNQAAPPATSWLITYGGNRETPAAVEARCRANWGRLARLQTAPADAYIALALDSDITGTTAVKKVAVWPNYSHALGGYKANTVTLYLAGDAGPVTAAEAALVRAAMLPYIGLHDQLEVQPCGTATISPVLVCYVDAEVDKVPAAAALFARLILLQQQLQIGGTLFASSVRRTADVPQIAVTEDALVDQTPAKNALITIGTGGITFQVGRP